MISLPDAPSNGKFRVLVVEDDTNIARLLMANLTRAGLECRYAVDGNAGLAAFQETNPHLVLTDIMMPGLNGRDLCAKIRETSNVPIIMMTAVDSEKGEVESFKVGADDYLAKPFNPQLLVARIVATLRRVYRYDTATGTTRPREQTVDVGTPEEPSLPPGWATCDSCGYMGPRMRFEGTDRTGRPAMICPNCAQSIITFNIS